MRKALSFVAILVALSTVALGLNIGSTGQVSVTSSATLIIAGNVGQTRQAVLIKNTSASTTIYVGTQTVTTSTGEYLGPLESITIPVNSAVYGISSGSTVTVSYLELVQ